MAQVLTVPPVNGVTPKVFRYSDYGIDPLSFVVVVNTRQLHAEPGIIREFVTGYLKAWNWACGNPVQAVTLARQHYTTTLSIAQGVAIWNLVCSYAHTPNSKGHPLGWMSLKDWQDTVKILTSNPTAFGATQNVPPASSLFTNEYVNLVYPPACTKGQVSTKRFRARLRRRRSRQSLLSVVGPFAGPPRRAAHAKAGRTSLPKSSIERSTASWPKPSMRRITSS